MEGFSDHEMLHLPAETAAIVDIAFDTRSYRSSKKVIRYVKKGRGEFKSIPNSAPRRFAVLTQALSKQNETLDSLYPYLDQFEQAMPSIELARSGGRKLDLDQYKFLDAVVEETLRESGFPFLLKSNDEVNAWIKETTAAVSETFEREPAFVQSGEAVARTITGLAFQIRYLLSGLTQRYQKEGSNDAVWGFVGMGIRMIRTSILTDVMARTSVHIDEGMQTSFSTTLQKFLDDNINPDYFDRKDTALEGLQQMIGRLPGMQEDIRASLHEIVQQITLPELAENLSHVQNSIPPAETIHRPWGHIVLTFRDPKGNPQFYVSNEPLGATILASRNHVWGFETESFDLGGSQPAYGLQKTDSCLISPEGKVSATLAGQMANLNIGQETHESLQRTERSCRRWLQEYWERLPAIFGDSLNLQPLFCIVDKGRTTLLYPASAGKRMREMIGETVEAVDEKKLCEELGILVYEDFEAYSLPWAIDHAPAEKRGEIIHLHSQQKSRREARKVLYSSLGGVVPEYRWLVEKLAPFGVTEVVGGDSHGKGSHSKLYRGDKFETFTKDNRRHSQPLHMSVLYHTLEHLGIDYREFIDSLDLDS